MCGTPHVSRTTVTGAFRPLTFRLPSIWASDAFATVLISAEGWAATVATKSSPAAESAIRIQPPIPNLQPLLQDLLHVVHDAIHLLQRQLQRLARRHVDARVLEQIDRVPGAARGEEGEVALRGGGVAGQYFFRQRRRSRERRRVLEDVEIQVEVRDVGPLVLDVVVDDADALVVAVVPPDDLQI